MSLCKFTQEERNEKEKQKKNLPNDLATKPILQNHAPIYKEVPPALDAIANAVFSVLEVFDKVIPHGNNKKTPGNSDEMMLPNRSSSN